MADSSQSQNLATNQKEQNLRREHSSHSNSGGYRVYIKSNQRREQDSFKAATNKTSPACGECSEPRRRLLHIFSANGAGDAMRIFSRLGAIRPISSPTKEIPRNDNRRSLTTCNFPLQTKAFIWRCLKVLASTVRHMSIFQSTVSAMQWHLPGRTASISPDTRRSCKMTPPFSAAGSLPPIENQSRIQMLFRS